MSLCGPNDKKLNFSSTEKLNEVVNHSLTFRRLLVLINLNLRTNNLTYHGAEITKYHLQHCKIPRVLINSQNLKFKIFLVFNRALFQVLAMLRVSKN